jgi:hypothetical protein
MVDQGSKHQTSSGLSQDLDKPASAVKSVTEQALSAGRNLKDRAVDMAGSSSDAIKTQASEFVDAAKDVASQATGKIKETADSQKTAGADYVGNLADTIRRAAREFDNDLPIAGAYIRKAASQIEGVADTIRTGNFNDLVRQTQSFARRRPTAFLGMAVLAGFGVVRFLKSSARDTEGGSVDMAGDRFAAGARPKHADSRGYRDEFTR